MDSHRRQTLGTMSPNVLPARRMSVAPPSRISKPGGGAGARPLQSMVPPGSISARQPGTARRSGHGQEPEDPRPVKDKKWQLEAKKSVICFAAANGYPKELDLKVCFAQRSRSVKICDRAVWTLEKAELALGRLHWTWCALPPCALCSSTGRQVCRKLHIDRTSSMLSEGGRMLLCCSPPRS